MILVLGIKQCKMEVMGWVMPDKKLLLTNRLLKTFTIQTNCLSKDIQDFFPDVEFRSTGGRHNIFQL